MTKEEILEGNKLIAEFDGVKLYEDWGEYLKATHHPQRYMDAVVYPDVLTDETLKEIELLDRNNQYGEVDYYSSFDCLMPVIQKIANTAIIETRLTNNQMYVSVYVKDYYYQSGTGNCNEQMFISVVEFIKWFNQNKNI